MQPKERSLAKSHTLPDSRKASVILSAALLPDKKSKYKEDKHCIVCNLSFGTTGTKRFVCKFCYHGVCNKCSPNRCFSAETSKEERSCLKCNQNITRSKTLDANGLRALGMIKKEVATPESIGSRLSVRTSGANSVDSQDLDEIINRLEELQTHNTALESKLDYQLETLHRTQYQHILSFKDSETTLQSLVEDIREQQESTYQIHQEITTFQQMHKQNDQKVEQLLKELIEKQSLNYLAIQGLSEKLDSFISKSETTIQTSNEDIISISLSEFSSQTSNKLDTHYSKIEKRLDALQSQLNSACTPKSEVKSDMNNQEDTTSLHNEIRRLSESISFIKLEIERRETCTEDRFGDARCKGCSLF